MISNSLCSLGTFSYIFRPKSEIDLSDFTEVPFQVQLLYVRKNGMQCLRVTTAKVSVTTDRAEAEAQANVSVISTHAANRAAKLAKKGNYEEAQMENRAALRFLKRQNAKEETEEFANQVGEMDRVLIEEKGKGYSKEERKMNRDDAAAAAISRAKKSKF